MPTTATNNSGSSQTPLFETISLNSAQRQAVVQSMGNLMVIAGAGSGKTRVITARIAHLIAHEQANPSSIVALTFTNKAATEMKERIANMLGTITRMPMVSTFHAYCLYLLRANAHLLPHPNFSIIDADDQQTLVKKILKTHNATKQINISQVCHHLSTYKNRLHANQLADDLLTPMLQEVYQAYEAEKKASHCFDFDDLIVEVLKLFKTEPGFKSAYHTRVRHILVDEYQDTSKIQHELLKQMAMANGTCVTSSLCAVGDEDQSIYSWRGAHSANMQDFVQDFAPVQIVKIEQNYRSVMPILQAANALIANNMNRNPKNLWSTKEAQGRILSVVCRSDDQEAELIAACVKSLPRGHARGDMAILYRTHYQSRAIEEAMIRHGISYRIIGGIRFYERKEIKDVLAYLRLLVNPFDRVALQRIINCPPRGLGEKFEEQLLAFWEGQPLLDAFQVLREFSTQATNAQQSRIQQFLRAFDGLNINSDPAHAMRTVVDRTQYTTYLHEHFDEADAQSKEENVRELIQSASRFAQSRNHLTDNPHTIQQPPLVSLLEQIALLQEDANELTSNDQVHMMSLHAAKGLEFDTVCIAGLEDTILPSSRSTHSAEALAEERRLLYVGITRAREHLLLLHAHSRTMFGQYQMQIPSRFLEELPAQHLHTIDLARISVPDLRTLCSRWYQGMSLAGFTTTTSAKANTPKPAATIHTTRPGTRSMPAGVVRTSSSRPTPAPRPVTQHATPPSTSKGPLLAGTGHTASPWPKNARVQHAIFGIGIVLEAQQEAGNYLVTALFAVGKKTVLSTFLHKVSDR